MKEIHKSGFVNIIGLPNVGKSTLINALVGQKLSIVSPKAQTTRKRIIGLLNDENYQIVFNDTPGILEPHYKMQESMNGVIKEAITDADVILYLIEPNMNEAAVRAQLEQLKTTASILLVINKCDTVSPAILQMKFDSWQDYPGIKKAIGISALNQTGMYELRTAIVDLLPESPAYYPKDDLSDRQVRFFVSDFIREKIFQFYHDEIPYHTEVVINSFEEKDNVDVIEAEILVNRKSHKGIVIGKGGEALKKLGIAAKAEIEKFTGKPAYLRLHVKVQENWIDNDRILKSLGY